MMKFDLANLKSKSQEWVDKAKENDWVRQTGNRARRAGQTANRKADEAAERAAQKYHDLTGRDITPAQVKKIAIGTAVGVTAVVALGALASAGAGPMMAGEMAAGEAGGSGDVMDQAHRFFAENGGSLNIETYAVDEFGCRLS